VTAFPAVTQFVSEASDQPPFLLADLPPSPQQIRLAFGIVVALLAAFVVTAPFATIQLARVDAFIPTVSSALIINDLIVSSLLFSQFVIVRRGAILALAIGYLFTALIIIPYTLTFPGAFAPTGLLGAGLQSAVWLYDVWHAGLPIAVIVYALRKDKVGGAMMPQRSTATVIAASVTTVIAIVCGLTLIATAGEWLLPSLLLDSIHADPSRVRLIGSCILFLSAVALALLWFKKRSVLDLWLMVTCLTLALEILMLNIVLGNRFSLGWYAGRIYSFAASIIVLLALLSETTTLYANLALAVMRRRGTREAQKFGLNAMSASIAHEIRQPLGAISTNASAGLRWLTNLENDPSAIDEARSAMKRILRDSERAAEVMTNLRAMFGNESHETALLDVNALVREVLVILDLDLRSQQVSVSTQLADGVPMIHGNRGQLQQVFLNLITNAIEAMGTSHSRMLRVCSDTIQQSSGVMVTIEDSGTGIKYENKDSIFEPFFTTKPGGTGIGLAICHSIVEAHGGTLAAFANKPYGSIFRVALPDGGL
jgi:signal transduction histidine kinase